MATNLPVNVDATYPDDPAQPGRKAHQQHHDAIHAYTNGHDTATDPHGDRAYADGRFVPQSLVDAVGDLLVGNGPDALKRLARGTARQVVRVNAAGTDLEFASSGETGTYTGDGAAGVRTIALSFTPDIVFVMANSGDPADVLWIVNATLTWQVEDAVSDFATTRTIVTNGFQVDAALKSNVSGIVYRFFAFKVG